MHSWILLATGLFATESSMNESITLGSQVQRPISVLVYRGGSLTGGLGPHSAQNYVMLCGGDTSGKKWRSLDSTIDITTVYDPDN